MATATPEVHSIEEMSHQVHRAADLLVGADALLRRRSYVETLPEEAGDALSELITESRAALSSVMNTVDGLLAREHEKERATRLHREEQARITAANVTVSR